MWFSKKNNVISQKTILFYLTKDKNALTSTKLQMCIPVGEDRCWKQSVYYIPMREYCHWRGTQITASNRQPALSRRTCTHMPGFEEHQRLHRCMAAGSALHDWLKPTPIKMEKSSALARRGRGLCHWQHFFSRDVLRKTTKARAGSADTNPSRVVFK